MLSNGSFFVLFQPNLRAEAIRAIPPKYFSASSGAKAAQLMIVQKKSKTIILFVLHYIILF